MGQKRGISLQRKRMGYLVLAGIVFCTGCSINKDTVKLDSRYPVNITVWHYYNGPQKNAFDQLVEQFNETVGAEKGIVVESHNQGDVNQLEQSVLASIKKEVGSNDPPNIFASYADNAYTVEKMGYLADLDQYFTKEEQADYVDSYIEEGRIGKKGELKIFPVAKSTEVMMINKTDWDKFAKATEFTLEDLETKEGVVEVAGGYYVWTDSLTPDIADDGKAFYGRDAVANLFITGAMQLGCEMFHVENQAVTLNLDKEVLRKIWEVYYVPHIRGYFASYGRFRSDDAKVGEIIALTGSTSSAAYFPAEVTKGDVSYPIEAIVLPVPRFADGENYAVQQGAGMVVVKGTKEEEYASVVFLKWLTDEKRNLEFSSLSGYLPVKKDANDPVLLEEQIQVQQEEPLTQKIQDSLRVGLSIVTTSKMYTNKAFEHSSEVRKILDSDLTGRLKADLEKIQAYQAQGMTRQEAAALFDTEENFEAWYESFREKLETAVQ